MAPFSNFPAPYIILNIFCLRGIKTKKTEMEIGLWIWHTQAHRLGILLRNSCDAPKAVGGEKESEGVWRS